METQMNADGTRMNADGIEMKRNHEYKSLDVLAMSYGQHQHSLRLSPAWKRRLSAFIGGFKALLWSWS
jgi:hypothetical protein